MGPIQEEIDKIKSTKKNTQQAIIAKHVQQEENPFKSYPDGIKQINEDVEQTKVVEDIFGKTTSPCGELISSNPNFFGGPVSIRLNSQEQVDNVTSKTYVNGSSGLGYHQLFDKFVCGKAKPILNKTVTSAVTSMFINNPLLTEIRNRENLEEVGNYFLSGCANVQTWEFPNLKKVGNYFAQNATIRSYRFNDWTDIDEYPYYAYFYAPDFRSLVEVGDYFMTGTTTETWIDLTPLKKAGNYFLYNNKIAGLLILPEDCDLTTTTYPLRGFQYACTVYVPENWKLPINNYTFSAQSSSSPAYSLGINICGPGADSLLAALPNRSSSPYRKLKKVELLLPEEGDERYLPTGYSDQKNRRKTSTLGALVPAFDYMGNWYPYRVVNETLNDKIGSDQMPYCPSVLMAEYVFTCPTFWYDNSTGSSVQVQTSSNGLTKWGTIIAPRRSDSSTGAVITESPATYFLPDLNPYDLKNENYGPINFKHIDSGYWGDSLGDLYATEGTYKNENSNLPNSFILNAVGRRSSNRINYEMWDSTPYSAGYQIWDGLGRYGAPRISYDSVYENSNYSKPSDIAGDFYKEMWLDYDHSWFGQGSGIPNTGSNGPNARRICRDRFGVAREYWLMDSASTAQKYYVTTYGSLSTKAISSTAYLRPVLF